MVQPETIRTAHPNRSNSANRGSCQTPMSDDSLIERERASDSTGLAQGATMPPTARREAGRQRAQPDRGRPGQLQSSHVAAPVRT
jgi:hypothetical protein